MLHITKFRNPTLFRRRNSNDLSQFTFPGNIFEHFQRTL